MSEPVVSVVIPVYNAVAHLDECLDSLVTQSLGFDRIEVVTVDDGSTDGTADLLDSWAERHPNIRVIHQPNSGAPGAPRNRGVAVARGEFLFFADPDDYLGVEALQRLVEAARRDGADVVLGRIKGVGRKASTGPFARSVAGGDVYTTRAVWSLTAHKLFRRSLVTEHGLRFAEGLRLAEEQEFIVPAYFLARGISVVADYDCYYLVHREGFAHLTRQVPAPEPFYASIRTVLETVLANTEPGPARNGLLRRWLQVELLGKFHQGFLRMPEQLRQRYTEQAGKVLADLVPTEAVAPLTFLDQLRDRLLRENAVEQLVALARFEHGKDGGRVEAELSGGPAASRIDLKIHSRLPLPAGPVGLRAQLVASRESDGRTAVVEVTPERDATGMLGASTTVDVRRLVAAGGRHSGAWHLTLRLEIGERTREIPVHRRGPRLPAAMTTRRVWLSGGRPAMSWVTTGQGGRIRINFAGLRGIVRAAQRKVSRRTGRVTSA